MLKSYLKQIISTNIILYYLWFKIVRKRKGLDISFFQLDTDVYIDGYPRSGNTFLIHLVKGLFPNLKLAHHLHLVAPIKIALLLDLPVFILIRNPMDCISSKYLKYFTMRGLDVNIDIEEKLLNQFIIDYITYYKYVKNNLNRIKIIKFDQLINSPKKIINIIKVELDIDKNIDNEDITHNINSYTGATNTFGSSRPNPQKEKYKSIVKEHICASDKSSTINELYESIINNS